MTDECRTFLRDAAEAQTPGAAAPPLAAERVRPESPVPAVQSMRLRAELARRGLLSTQLGSYWCPDTDSTIDPKKDPETIELAFEFARWVESETVNWKVRTS